MIHFFRMTSLKEYELMNLVVIRLFGALILRDCILSKRVGTVFRDTLVQ